MNRAIFTQYIRQYLAPVLRPGDVVILDNLSSHKGAEAAVLVEARGARLLFLPPTRPTSIRSRWPSTNSSICSVKPASEPAMAFGAESAASSTTSHPRNAATTSDTPDMLQRDHKRL